MKMKVLINGKWYEICYESGWQNRRCSLCAFSTDGKGVMCKPNAEMPAECPLSGEGSGEGYYFKEVAE